MAASVNIRIPADAHRKLRERAQKDHKGLGEVIGEAADALEKERFWTDYYAAYQRLRADPEAWHDFREELAAWDVTLMDGLENLP